MPIRHLCGAVVALALLTPLASLPACAQVNGSGPPPAGATDQVAALIAQYPQGGVALTAAIATLIELQPNLAGAVIAAANAASPAVAGALAAGLAQGAVLLAVTDPAATQAIRAAVYASGNTSLAAAFGVAYTVALAENPTAQAALLAANPFGGGSTQLYNLQANNLVSPN